MTRIRCGVLLLAAALGSLLAWLATPPPARADEPAGEEFALPVGHLYVGAAKCKSCHKKELLGNQYATWLAGPHHGAFETLKSDASLAIATERGLAEAPDQAPDCLGCHVTAFGVPADRLARPLDPAEGVQCESCHGPGKDYRKKKIMSDPKVARENGLWEVAEDARICTTCHNPESPTFDPARYELPDGSTAGFDFEVARSRIPHAIPADVKGKYLEIEAQLKAEGKKVK